MGRVRFSGRSKGLGLDGGREGKSQRFIRWEAEEGGRREEYLPPTRGRSYRTKCMQQPGKKLASLSRRTARARTLRYVRAIEGGGGGLRAAG